MKIKRMDHHQRGQQTLMAALLLGMMTGSPLLAEDKSGTREGLIKLPGAGGTVQKDEAAFSFSTSKGMAGYSIPLPELPARAGFGPSVAVNYSQYAGDTGSGLGIGWSIQTSAIEVNDDLGTAIRQRYEENQDFYSHLSLDGQRLISLYQDDATADPLFALESSDRHVRVTYATKPQTVSILDHRGQRKSVNFSRGFIVSYPDGRKAYYEEAADSAQLDPKSPGHATRWPITLEVNPRGDAIVYTYFKDKVRQANGQIVPGNRSYLKSISFAGDQSRYDFELIKTRSSLLNYRSAFKLSNEYLYGGVVARFQGEVQGRVCFAYVGREENADPFTVRAGEACRDQAQSDLKGDVEAINNRSLNVLDQLRLVYRGGNGPLTPDQSFPNIRFSYSNWNESNNERQIVYDVPALSGFNPNQSRMELIDYNLDALVDIVRTSNGKSEVFNGQDSLSSSFQIKSDLSVERDGRAVAVNFDSPAFHLVDMNGDSLTDLVEIGQGQLFVYLRDRAGNFTYTGAPANLPWINSNLFSGQAHRWLDLNGDGLTDVLTTEQEAGKVYWKVYLNRTLRAPAAQLDFQFSATRLALPDAFTASLLKDEATLITDVNGDGLPDFVRVKPEKGGLCYYDNRGDVYGTEDQLLFGHEEPSTLDQNNCAQGKFIAVDGLASDVSQASRRIWFLDANGDGILDLMSFAQNDTEMRVWLGFGNGDFLRDPLKFSTLSESGAVQVSLGAAGREATRMADIDGDGQTELVLFQVPTASIKPVLVIDFNRLDVDTQLVKSNLLTTIVNDTGIRYDMRYVSSIDELTRDAKHQRDASSLHFPVYLVKQLVTSELDATGQAWKPGREVTEMLYHDPIFDPLSKRFVGFKWVESVHYGDEYFGDRATQESYYKKEVFADDYRLAGKLIESSIHEFIPTGSFAEQSSGAEQLKMDDVGLHSMKSYAQNQILAQAGRLLSQDSSKWELVPNAEGYNDEWSYYQRMVEETKKEYGRTGVAQSRKSTYSDFDTYNIAQTTRIEESAITAFDVTIPGRVRETQLNFAESRQQLASLGIVTLPASMEVYDVSQMSRELIQKEEYTYNEAGLRTETLSHALVPGQVSNPEGFVTKDKKVTVFYDVFGNPIRQIQNNILLETVTYDAEGIHARVTENAAGFKTLMSYGSDTLDTCGSMGTRHVPAAQMNSFRDPFGICHALSYDALGRRSAYYRVDGYQEDYAYRFADQGTPARVLKKAKRYASAGEVPAGEQQFVTTLEAFDASGQQLASLEVTESGRGVRVLSFDEYNRNKELVRKWTPFVTESVSLDQVFQSGMIPTASVNAVLRYRYDGPGRVKKVLYPSGKVDTYTYEGWGRTRLSNYSKGPDLGNRETLTQSIERDGKVMALKDPTGAVTIFGRDAYDNLVRITMAGESKPRTYVYDSLGRKLQQCVPGTGCTYFRYDELDHLAVEAVYDTAGVKQHLVTYLYDALNRLIELTSDGVLIQRNRYDTYPQNAAPQSGNGQAIGMPTVSESLDPHKLFNVKTILTYDELGRLIAKKVLYSGVKNQEFLTTTRYTLDGTIKEQTDPYTVKSVYRLAASKRFMGVDAYLPWEPNTRQTLIENINYSGQGFIERIDYRRGARTHLSYNQDTLVLEEIQTTYKDAQGHDQWLQNAKLSFDGNGSVTEIEDLIDQDTAFGPVNRSGTFQYNARDELIGYQRYGESHEFVYDQAGNFVKNSEAGTIVPSAQSATQLLPRSNDQIEYTFNKLGQLESRRLRAGVRVNEQSEAQKRIDILATRYDALGRLVYTRTSKAEVFYGYDARGTRLYKRVKDLTSSEVADSLFPTESVIVEPTGAQSFVMVGKRRVARIEHESQSLARGTWYYYLLDHLGSTDFVMHENGTPVEQMVYRAYGSEPALETVANGARFLAHKEAVQSLVPKERTHHRFTGQYLDDDSGIYYYGARYYDPLLGRFLTPDPLYRDEPERCVSSVVECGLYSYAGNNPMKFIDSSGFKLVLAGNYTADDVKQWNNALAYLKQDPTAAKLVTDLETRDEVILVFFSHSNTNMGFLPGVSKSNPIGKDLVIFDPTLGVKVTDGPGKGKVFTPAMGLLHELDHAQAWLNDPKAFVERFLDKNKKYDNAEEKRAVTGAERAFGKHMKEPIRDSHGGKPVHVKCSTCTDKGDKFKQPEKKTK